MAIPCGQTETATASAAAHARAHQTPPHPFFLLLLNLTHALHFRWLLGRPGLEVLEHSPDSVQRALRQRVDQEM